MTSLLCWTKHRHKKDNTGNQENDATDECQQVLVDNTGGNEKKGTDDEKDPTRQLTLEFQTRFVALIFAHCLPDVNFDDHHGHVALGHKPVIREQHITNRTAFAGIAQVERCHGEAVFQS